MKMTQLASKVPQSLHDVVVTPLSEAHLPEAWLLWNTQYQEELSASCATPNQWNSHREEIESILRKHMKSNYSMVAKNRDEIVGYMFFYAFPFHGEKTAFCPIVGHAAKSSYRRQIFENLYQDISKKLVADGILSHVITYFTHDENLGITASELGFGLIVVDAFRGLDALPSMVSSINIIQADPSHIDMIEALGEEARGYYLEAPLFLTREKHSHDFYQSLFSEDSAIFLAFSGNEPVGFMRIRKNRELDAITLSDMGTGLIDQIGAYVKPAFRRQRIGRALLSKCVQWCQHRDITQIHVDFESANMLGRSFWLKYFTAAMHSGRRTVYRDVLPTQES
jgi:GNAT superfamily N-acetyltransferase